MTEPTPGEIVRRLDEIASWMDRTSAKLDEFRNWAERLYVPRMEWVEARRAINERIDNIADDVKTLQGHEDAGATFRRQVLLALAVASFSAFVSVAIAVAGLVLGKGP